MESASANDSCTVIPASAGMTGILRLQYSSNHKGITYKKVFTH